MNHTPYLLPLWLKLQLCMHAFVSMIQLAAQLCCSPAYATAYLVLTQLPISATASAAGPTKFDSCCRACCLALL
jgi:hypothetical protein